MIYSYFLLCNTFLIIENILSTPNTEQKYHWWKEMQL
jgi:hypothetical protein